uniref:Uncharacterized protein n=1 Tax=mine drainage metagenome TaxID=410659 RepID=E6Q7V1_9ZZZZ
MILQVEIDCVRRGMKPGDLPADGNVAKARNLMKQIAHPLREFRNGQRYDMLLRLAHGLALGAGVLDGSGVEPSGS